MNRTKILFLHGYYGSHLRDKNSRRQFLNLSQVLPFRSAPALDTWPDLEPEILRTAGFGPIQQSVYLKPLQALESATGFPVLTFAYDWRRCLKESAQKLIQSVENSTSPLWVFSHSMGGLVVLSALVQGQNRPQFLKKISGITMAAAPLQGLPVLFRNFLMGTPFYYNPYYLRPDVLLTYVSPYQMLPEKVKLLTPDGEIGLQTAKYEAWVPHLTQFQSAALGSREFQRKIQEAAEFREHIQSSDRLQLDFPLHVVQARGLDTPAAYEILPSGQLSLDHYYLGPFIVPKKKFHAEDGDRTVLLSSQVLPPTLQKTAQVKAYSAGHLEILTHTTMLEDFARSVAPI